MVTAVTVTRRANPGRRISCRRSGSRSPPAWPGTFGQQAQRDQRPAPRPTTAEHDERGPPADRGAQRGAGRHADQRRRRPAGRGDGDRPADPVRRDDAAGVAAEHAPEHAVGEAADQPGRDGQRVGVADRGDEVAHGVPEQGPDEQRAPRHRAHHAPSGVANSATISAKPVTSSPSRPSVTPRSRLIAGSRPVGSSSVVTDRNTAADMVTSASRRPLWTTSAGDAAATMPSTLGLIGRPRSKP